MYNSACSPCRSQNADPELESKKERNGEETERPRSGLAKLELKEVIAFHIKWETWGSKKGCLKTILFRKINHKVATYFDWKWKLSWRKQDWFNQHSTIILQILGHSRFRPCQAFPVPPQFSISTCYTYVTLLCFNPHVLRGWIILLRGELKLDRLGLYFATSPIQI